MSLTATMTLAEIAVARPGATRAFRRRGLDFCCHGRRPLSEACQERGLDPAEVIAEVAREIAPEELATDWTSAPLEALVQHIVTRYHESLRRQLPEVIQLAHTVETVHAAHERCPEGLTDLLHRVHGAVQEHLAKEETILFPMILAGKGAYASGPINVMEMEHEDHGQNLARLRAMTDGFVAPPDTCTTWKALCASLDRLERELMDHIHLENNVLFPRALCE